MADIGAASASSRTSVAALVTYWLLAIWTGVVGGTFVMSAYGITLSAALLGQMSNVQSITGTLLVAAVSFWVGSTQGTKALGDKLAESGAKAQERIADLAVSGNPSTPPAGTPPPAAPPASVAVDAEGGAG